MNIHKTKFILASQSPRRSELLTQIGIVFETQPSNFIEDLSINLPPSSLSMNFAENKAKAVANKYKIDRTYSGSTTYAPIGDQLDLLWHAIDADADLKGKFSAFYNSIKAVKDANPKP